MKNKVENPCAFRILMMLIAIFSVISVIFVILAFSKYTFHSDCAAYLFLAKEQAKQLKLFPERFHYTTGIFSLIPSILMVPFVNVIHNDYLLHEIGSILAILLVVLAIFFLFKDKKRSAFLMITIFLMPISYTYMDMVFYQSAYISSILYSVLKLIAVRRLLAINESTIKRQYGILLLYTVITVFINYTSIQTFLTIEAPTLCAFGVMILLKEGGQIKRWRSQKQLIFCIGFACSILVFCVLHYIFLCHSIGYDPNRTMGGFVASNRLFSHLEYTISSIFDLYGLNATTGLFQITTMKNCMMVIYFLLSAILIPLYLLVQVKKIEDSFYQFLILYTSFANFFIVFMMFFLGMAEGRYFIPVLFHNVILFSLTIDWISRNKKEIFSNWLLIFCLIGVMMMQINYYVAVKKNGWSEQVSLRELIHPTVENPILQKLKEMGFTYGYATFWNAYSAMVAMNGEIEIAAYDKGNPKMPYFFDGNTWEDRAYYGVSEDLYSVEQHPGKCFILVRYDESIPDIYYEIADEILQEEGFTVLTYHKNINLYEEIYNREVARFVALEEPYQFFFGVQEYSDGTFYKNGTACLLPNAQMRFNFFDLKRGSYFLKLSGEHSILDTEVKVITQNGEIPLTQTVVSGNEMEFMFTVEEDQIANYILVKNLNDTMLEINALIISK